MLTPLDRDVIAVIARCLGRGGKVVIATPRSADAALRRIDGVGTPGDVLVVLDARDDGAVLGAIDAARRRAMTIAAVGVARRSQVARLADVVAAATDAA
jgi:hypothetical protein